MSDKESQNDEICALQSIYNEEELQIHEENGLSSGLFYTFIDLPEGFKVVYRDLRYEDSVLQEIPVKYLPPLCLHFRLPHDYPSQSPPNFLLTCQWLQNNKLALIRKKFVKIWKEIGGMEVLFLWTQFLKEETLNFLKITDTLDVSSMETNFRKCEEFKQIRRAQYEEDRNKIGKTMENENNSSFKEPEMQATGRTSSENLCWKLTDIPRQQDRTREESTVPTQDGPDMQASGFTDSRRWQQRSNSRHGRQVKDTEDLTVQIREYGCKSQNEKDEHFKSKIPHEKKKSENNDHESKSSPCDENRYSSYRPTSCMISEGQSRWAGRGNGSQGVGNRWRKDNHRNKVVLGNKNENYERTSSYKNVYKKQNIQIERTCNSSNYPSDYLTRDTNKYSSASCRDFFSRSTDSKERVNNSYKKSYANNNNHQINSFKSKNPRMSVIQLLQEYNEARKHTEFNRTFFACNICFQDKQGAQCTRFHDCSHVFCKACVAEYFETRIKDGNVQSICCPEDKCTSEALPSQVQELVSAEMFSRYDSVLLTSLLDTMEGMLYCPRPACQYPVTVEPGENMATCPSCNYVFCVFCKMVYHGIEPCRFKSSEKELLVTEYIDANDGHKLEMELRYGRKTLQNLVDIYLSEHYLKKNCMKCPNCTAAIEKLDGCNKMVCWKCNAFFCWLCGEHLGEKSPYVHFSNPSSKCYKQLFLGVANMDEDDDFVRAGGYFENDEDDDD